MPSPTRRQERMHARQEQEAAQLRVDHEYQLQLDRKEQERHALARQYIFGEIDRYHEERKTFLIGPVDRDVYLDGIHYLEDHYGDDVLVIEHSHAQMSQYPPVVTYTALVRWYPPLTIDTVE